MREGGKNSRFCLRNEFAPVLMLTPVWRLLCVHSGTVNEPWIEALLLRFFPYMFHILSLIKLVLRQTL